MSEDLVSVLLPTASVDIFAPSEQLRTAANALVPDWRFARVALAVEGTGIEAAIEKYTQYQSPDIVIIDTQDIGPAFIEQLTRLAGVCAEGTDAVVIGPKNDVQLYRSLVSMGIRDYLVHPISQEELANVIGSILIAKKGIRESRLVAVVGAKGGVGATTVTQMLAWSLAQDLKQKTMLIDAGSGWGVLPIAFGIEPHAPFAEAVRIAVSGSEDDMNRINHAASDTLTLFASGGDALLSEDNDPNAVEALIDRVMRTWPVVVVDLSCAGNMIKKRILARASEIVLVTTPFLPSLRNARSLLTEIRLMRIGFDAIDLVVTMRGQSPGFEVGVDDMKNALDLKPIVTIPFEPKLFNSCETAGKPVGSEPAALGIMHNIKVLARKACAFEGKVDDDSGAKKVVAKGLFSQLTDMVKTAKK